MPEIQPGVIFNHSAQKGGHTMWLLGFVAGVVSVVSVLAMSVVALARGDMAATTGVYGFSIPNWTLGVLALPAVFYVWWVWRNEAPAMVKGEAVINVRMRRGGLDIIGNYGEAMGTSLQVDDKSQLRISLVKNRTANYGANKLYGLRFESSHGNVVMDLRLTPDGLDLHPLLGELALRRVSVQLDPELAERHSTAPIPGVV